MSEENSEEERFDGVMLELEEHQVADNDQDLLARVFDYRYIQEVPLEYDEDLDTESKTIPQLSVKEFFDILGRVDNEHVELSVGMGTIHRTSKEESLKKRIAIKIPTEAIPDENIHIPEEYR